MRKGKIKPFVLPPTNDPFVLADRREEALALTELALQRVARGDLEAAILDGAVRNVRWIKPKFKPRPKTKASTMRKRLEYLFKFPFLRGL